MALFSVLFHFFFLIALQISIAQDSAQLWCVAKNNADDAALQAALDWACGPGAADCGPIQQGGQCYLPDDLQSHASYAFNDYFVKHGFDLKACDFSGTAAPISLDPSHDKCVYPSSTNGKFSGSSSAGLGPASSDISGATTLQPMTWLSTPSLAMAILVGFTFA